MTQYPAVLVGLGKMGWTGFGNPAIETHYNAISTHPGLRLVAGVDADVGTRVLFQRETGHRVYPDIASALKREDASVAIIATPPETHVECVKMAQQHRSIRGIICEKPLAPTVSACQEIIDACSGRILVVGHQRRYERRHRETAVFVRSGVLGHVRRVVCAFSGDYLSNGSHAVDTARFIAGQDAPIDLNNVYGARFDVRFECDAGSLSIESRGRLDPGYLHAMYDDLLECMRLKSRPICSGEDGLEAVRICLEAAA